MIVAQVIGNLNIGGAERLFVNLCNALDVERIIVFLIGDSEVEPNMRLDLSPDIEVRTMRIRQRSWIRDVWRLSRLFRETGCDVVHTHMFWSNLYGSIAARLARVEVIITSEHGRNEWKSQFHKWLEVNIISRFANARLCVSEDILRRRRDADRIPAHLLMHVPNGTIVPPMDEREKVENVIGSVGRLVDAKDYPTMVRAIGILARRGVDVRLDIVGEGLERPAIEKAIAGEGLESRIRLAGSQSNIDEWLNGWLIFASSSIREGQPMALLEAMAAGLPCVATAVGGVPETIRNGTEGVLVPAGDPRALADGIEKLLQNPDMRMSLGKAARERVIRDFSIEALAATCRQIYDTTLSSVSARHRA